MQSNSLKYTSINDITVSAYVDLIDNRNYSVLFNGKCDDKEGEKIAEKINRQWLNETGGDKDSNDLIKKQAVVMALYWRWIASRKKNVGLHQAYLSHKSDLEEISKRKETREKTSFRKLTRIMNRHYYTHSEDYSKMKLIDFAIDYKEFINEQDRVAKAKLANKK